MANNTASGGSALYSNTTGANNIAFGANALVSNTTGGANVAIGSFALPQNTTGFSNVAIGPSALWSNTATSNLVAIGDSALFNNTGTENTAVGSKALYANTTGEANTANGNQALVANTTGTANTAVGTDALFINTSGAQNTAVGNQALSFNQTGKNITALGYFSGVGVDGLNDATAIGASAVVSSSNTVQLGDNNVTAVNSYGTFNTISDGRFKFNIQENVSGLDFIMKLRPVTYQLDTRKIQNSLLSGKSFAAFANTDSNVIHSMSIRRTGFIAQEVEKAANETGFNFDAVKKPENDKDHYSLSYEEFVVPLVKAVQEQQKQIEDLKNEIEELKKLVSELSKK